MYKRVVLVIISFYQFTMSALATIVFLLVPLTKEKLNYTFVGLGLFIWLIFILIYVSMAASVKNMLENKYPSKDVYYENVTKDATSFVAFSLSSVLAVVFIYFFMRWAISAYIPEVSAIIINTISVINGLIFGAIHFVQYFFLPEE